MMEPVIYSDIWTDDEKHMFIKASYEHKLDFEAIQSKVVTKLTRQVIAYQRKLVEKLQLDPSHPNADLLKIWNVPEKQYKSWTDEEHTEFIKTIRLHGKNYDELDKALETRSRVQIRTHLASIVTQIRAKKDHPDSDLLEVLETPLKVHNPWTEEEHNTFVRVIEKHGKDFNKLVEAIPTRER